MKNLEQRKRDLNENFRIYGGAETLKDYVEATASSDPGFFRWLFSEDFDKDFDSSLSNEQKEEYTNFLNSL